MGLAGGRVAPHLECGEAGVLLLRLPLCSVGHDIAPERPPVHGLARRRRQHAHQLHHPSQTTDPQVSQPACDPFPPSLIDGPRARPRGCCCPRRRRTCTWLSASATLAFSPSSVVKNLTTTPPTHPPTHRWHPLQPSSCPYCRLCASPPHTCCRISSCRPAAWPVGPSSPAARHARPASTDRQDHCRLLACPRQVLAGCH